MTRRDRMWRVAGAVSLAGGYAIGALGDPDASPIAGIAVVVGFTMAMMGLILLVQGKRVAAAIRIERSRHRLLPFAIRARRRAR